MNIFHKIKYERMILYSAWYNAKDLYFVLLINQISSWLNYYDNIFLDMKLKTHRHPDKNW